MPWQRRKHEHECRPPESLPIFRRVRTGDEWVCRRCRRRWRVTVTTYPNSRYALRWREVTADG